VSSLDSNATSSIDSGAKESGTKFGKEYDGISMAPARRDECGDSGASSFDSGEISSNDSSATSFGDSGASFISESVASTTNCYGYVGAMDGELLVAFGKATDAEEARQGNRCCW
jgi:hypothetical protein